MGMGYCYFAILYFTNICCASGLFPPDFRLPTFLTPNPLPSTNPLNGIQLLSSTPSSECITGPSVYYNGTRNVTGEGIPCQRWDVKIPHRPRHVPQDGGHHNYCRNPDRDVKGTWCYTIHPKKRWRYCDIPKCPDHGSWVIWTNYDQNKHTSHIMSTNADPEYVSGKLKAGLYVEDYTVIENRSWSEIYALVGDQKNHRLIFADRQSKIIGFQDLKSNLTKHEFEGIAFDVENLAYDWMTGNVYWTDSSFNWIVVGDPAGRFYKPLYRDESFFVHAIAVHSTQRKLYFSLVHHLTDAAALCVADLAATDASVILRSPQIRDVLGMVVDYTDDRIYFTEFTGITGRVSSCRLDGSNKIIHASKPGAQFWGVAAYLDHLYVSDVMETGYHYSIRIITKEGKKELNRYSMKGLPRGITVMSENEEKNFGNVSMILGSCNDSFLPACHHICLPQVGSPRKCACSVGYKLVDGHRCQAISLHNNSLLITDVGQGKVFQLPFHQSDGNDSTTFIEVSSSAWVSSAAVGRNGNIYWSDRINNSVHITGISHNSPEFRYDSVQGSYFVTDPCTSNVYFVDTITQSVKVMSNGYVKTLLSLDEMDNSIQMLAHDIENQKLYWTDTRNAVGAGQVGRMNTDGSGVEIVYSQLNWPRGIVVDHRRGSLFISEARTGMIYEQPLAFLHSIRSRSPQNISRQFDLAGHVTRHRIFINDIKIFNDHLYFYDDTDHYIESFNLNSGPASMARFGPKNFVSISSLAVFSLSNQNVGIDCAWSSCARRNPCSHVCVDVGPRRDRKPVCLCDDNGTGVSSAVCEGATPSANSPPSYGKTCPGDLVFALSACKTESKNLWIPPTWVDDHTPTSLLNTTSEVPEQLGHGTYPIRYTATDQHGATAECTFYVTLQGIECNDPPKLPFQLKPLGFSCGKQVGSTLLVACKNPSNAIQQKPLETFKITCVKRNLWVPERNLSKACGTSVTSSNVSNMTSLNAGGIVGICILLIVLLFGIIFAGLMAQRKGSLWLVKINFPKIWKQQKPDAVQIDLSSRAYNAGPLSIDEPLNMNGLYDVDGQKIITTLHRDV